MSDAKNIIEENARLAKEAEEQASLLAIAEEERDALAQEVENLKAQLADRDEEDHGRDEADEGEQEDEPEANEPEGEQEDEPEDFEQAALANLAEAPVPTKSDETEELTRDQVLQEFANLSDPLERGKYFSKNRDLIFSRN